MKICIVTPDDRSIRPADYFQHVSYYMYYTTAMINIKIRMLMFLM